MLRQPRDQSSAAAGEPELAPAAHCWRLLKATRRAAGRAQLGEEDALLVATQREERHRGARSARCRGVVTHVTRLWARGPAVSPQYIR